MVETSKEKGKYLDSEAYRKAFRLALYTHGVTMGFPAEERRGLAPDVVKSAIAIPSSIADGYRSRSPKDMLGNLINAFNKCGMLECQLSLCHDLKYIGTRDYQRVLALEEEVLRSIQRMIKEVKV